MKVKKKKRRRWNKLTHLLSINRKVFFSNPSFLTFSQPFKEFENLKKVEVVQMEQPVSYKFFQDKNTPQRNLFQVPKEDPELLLTPVKSSASPAQGRPGQYNSPIGLYSPETLREMMLMQGKLGEGSAASGGVSLPG